MAFTKLELGAALGLVGLTVGQTIGLYTYAAPGITDLRSSPITRGMRQALLDADMYGCIFGVVLIGGTVSILTHSFLPVMLAAVAFAAISYSHRSILNSAPPQ